MKCPSEIRVCPNGWTDCSLCAHLKACEAGTYTAELESPELETDLGIIITEVTEPVVQAEVVESDASIRGTWASRLNAMTEAERWAEYRKYHPPSLHDKEAIPLDGPSAPGGGGHCKVPPKPPYKMPEYLKTWGN